MIKYIKNVISSLLGKKMPQEDPTKVLNKINDLNRTQGGVWIALQGWNFISTVNYQINGPAVNPGFGSAVKVFLNTTTGEMKMFDARLFFK